MNTQIRKTIVALLLGGLLCMTSALPIYAVNLNVITINGVQKALNIPIISSERSVLISIRGLGEMLGAQVSWSEADRGMHLQYNGKDYRFGIGSSDVSIDGTTRTLSAPAQIIDGYGYVPLNALSDVFEGQIELKDDMYFVTVYQESGKGYGNYTFDELLTLAHNNSLDIVKAKNNYERARILYNEAADDYIEYPGNDDNVTEDMVRFGNLLNLEGNEISLKTAEIAISTVKDQVRYELKGLLNDLCVAEGALALANEELDIQRTVQLQNELKYQNGLLSFNDFEKGKETLNTKQLAVASKESERQALRVKLDNILKLGLDNYGFAAYSKIPYSSLEIGDVNTHIQSVLDSSPDIFSLKQLVKLKESNLSYYVFNSSMDPYEAVEIDISTAKQNLKIAQDSLVLSLRQMNEQLNQLGSTYSTLQSERAKLQRDYDAAKLNKELGLITDLALKQIKLGIDTLDQQTLTLKGSYEALKGAYLQPWAAQ